MILCKNGFSCHAGSMKRLSARTGARCDLPAAISPSSRVSVPTLSATAPGCWARLPANRAQVAFGIIRLANGLVALVSSRSSGAASSSTLAGGFVGFESAMVIVCFRLRNGDVAFLDLAGGTLGQRVDEPDQARVLVSGHPLLDVVAQFFGRDRGALLEGDGGADFLAQGVVRNADDGGFGHRPGARRAPPRSRAGRRCSRRG